VGKRISGTSGGNVKRALGLPPGRSGPGWRKEHFPPLRMLLSAESGLKAEQDCGEKVGQSPGEPSLLARHYPTIMVTVERVRKYLIELRAPR